MTITTLRILAALASATFNLTPLYGVYAWGWDAFQLLLLYWGETIVLFCCAFVHIRFIPAAQLGTMIINGRTVSATHRGLMGFFALSAVPFIAGHLFFLCVLFSGDWFRRLHGLGDVMHTFLIASGAWKPLLMAAIAGTIDVLIGEYHPAFVDALARRLNLVWRRGKSTPDAFGSIVGGIYARIVIIQAGVIFGGMALQRYGTIAPLAIVVGLKTLVDLGRRWNAMFGAPSSLSPSDGSRTGPEVTFKDR
jgi:Family of unknown function (DUF6498)